MESQSTQTLIETVDGWAAFLGKMKFNCQDLRLASAEITNARALTKSHKFDEARLGAIRGIKAIGLALIKYRESQINAMTINEGNLPEFMSVVKSFGTIPTEENGQGVVAIKPPDNGVSVTA